MALILIDQFEFGIFSSDVYIYLDDSNFTISADSHVFVPSAVTSSTRGRSNGDIFYSNCFDGTKVTVRSSNKYPYGIPEVVTGSSECEQPVTCDIAATYSVVDETKYGANDGSITINATSSAQILGYSINGVNYQAGNVFSNLSPGEYSVDVYDANDCWTYLTVSVGAALPVYGCKDPLATNFDPDADFADNSQCTYPVPADKLDDAYDLCYFFRLISETNGVIDIEEPIKWSDINVSLKRDPDWHGFNYEYSDGELDLEFDCESGRDFINQVYQEQGVNGLIILQFGYTIKQNPDSEETIEYEGKLNLTTRKWVKERLAISVERAGLHDLVKSRWDTKVNLFATSDLDNNQVTAPTPYRLVLHPKLLINNFTKNTGPEGQRSFTTIPSKNITIVYFTFNLSETNAENSNIEQLGGTSLGVSQSYPPDSNLFLFNLENDGDFEFNISLRYNFDVKLSATTFGGTPQIDQYWLENYLQINNEPPVLIGATKTGTPGTSQIGNQIFTGSIANYQRYLKKGDKVYIYAKLWIDRNGNPSKYTNAYIEMADMDIDIIAKTAADFSSCRGMLVHEAISHAAQLITGQQGAFYSDFFGREDLLYPSDGCGSKNIITNGFEIRSFDPTKQNYKPPQISLGSLLKSLNSMFCIGMAYETIDGIQKMRVEQREYFYQDVEILELDVIGDYEDRVATDQIFNNIEIGYKKFLDEGIRLLDEFNTQHQYLAPIKRHGNPFSELSDLVGSGYAIETTRRNQFKNTPQDSTTYDDDCFIISVSKSEAKSLQILFSKSSLKGNQIIFPGAGLPFTAETGDYIKITGSTYNNMEFRVIEALNNSFIVSENVNFELVFATIENVTRPFVTEKDEAFDYVANLISPDSAYNLRHSPKRMLLRWAKWLNGGFFYQQAGDIIKNTFFKQNGALITRLKQDDPCPLGDFKRENLQESADVYLSEFQEKESFFIPEYASFTSDLTKSQFRLLRECMTGKNQAGKNYGYITIPLPDRNKLKAWLWEVTYNPNTRKVLITVLKKEVVFVNEPDFDCSDYADYTFADFENTPNLPKRIEQCRFEDFN